MKDKVAEYISRELMSRKDGETITPDQDLLISGLLDSLGVMSLVHFLEQEFEVGIPPEDVTIENFQTVEAICGYLSGRNGTK